MNVRPHNGLLGLGIDLKRGKAPGAAEMLACAASATDWGFGEAVCRLTQRRVIWLP